MNRTSLLFFIVFLFVTINAGAQLWKQYSDSAKYYNDQKKSDLAIDYYIKANDILAVDSNLTGTHAVISNQLGLQYQNRGKYAESEKFYSESKKIREKVSGKESEDYIRVCSNLNYLYVIMGRYEQAEQLSLETNELAEKVLGKNNYEYARTCRNLGMLYRTLGQFENAESFFLEAQTTIGVTKGKDKFEYASITNDVGGLYILAGFLEKALEQLLAAKELYAKTLGKENPSYAAVCNNLGLVYKNLQEFSKSEQLYLETKSIREKQEGKQHPSYAQCCYNLGDLYLLIGQYNKAEKLLLEAQQIYQVSPGVDHPDYAKVCSKLGKLYTTQDNYEKAEPLLLLAKEIREKRFTKKHPEYALSVAFLGELYERMGLLEKAEKYILESYQITRQVLGDSHPEIFNSSAALASIYSQMKKFDKAEQMLNEVSAAWSGFGPATSAHRIINEFYARLFWAQQKPEKAKEYYQKAIESQMNQIRQVFQFTSENEKSAFLQNIANSNDEYYSFFYRFSDPATQLFDLSLAYRQLILSSFQSVRESIYQNGDSTLVNQYNAWMSMRKSMASSYSKNNIPDDIRIMEDSANELEKKLIRNSSSLQKQLQNPSWNSIRESLAPGEAAIEFIAFQYLDGTNYTDSIYYAGLLLRKDRPGPELVRLFEEKELTEILKIYKGTSAEQTQLSYLYTWKDPAGHERSKTIYDLVWKPFEGKLGGVHTVYFSPAGSLFKISFAALPVNNGRVLSDAYRLIQLNTTASVVNASNHSITASDKIILYGGIQYDLDSTTMKLAASQSPANEIASRALPDDLTRDGVPTFNFLSGTAKEISGIGKLAEEMKYNVIVEEGKNATEESFKILTAKNSPGVLHIATHGFFFPDPKNVKRNQHTTTAAVFSQSGNPLIRSGLALAGANNAWKGNPVVGVEDGILTAYEVSNMYLPNTKLAVLSACETGLGDIEGSEGVYGLQRAFKIAGVENLLMSLWKVPDFATSEFMQLFYKNLFAKETIQDAFYNTQTVMKNKYRNDPYKWAAWVLIR